MSEENEVIDATVEEVVKAEEEVETQQVSKEETTAAPESENPFFAYVKNAFSREHIDEFMKTLTDEQKSFVYVFCSGFETAIGRHIVGVYDTEYINGYHFTKEILDTLKIIVKPVEVEDNNLKFTIVAQLI